MDYRYETKESARDFHKQRRAFLIYKNKVEFMPKGCHMSHYEYSQIKGMSKEEFNKMTRGCLIGDNVLFYKDNFIYDDLVIKEALEHIDEIALELDRNEFNIYFGALPQDNFKPDFLYGKYKNGEVIRLGQSSSPRR